MVLLQPFSSYKCYKTTHTDHTHFAFITEGVDNVVGADKHEYRKEQFQKINNITMLES
jgi:hypothetical protein